MAHDSLDAAAPLIALDLVVLDTETTGLSVAEDRIVQIGAVRMRGAALSEEAALDVLVDPGVPIPEASSRIHGIRDADVAGALDTAAALEQLSAFIGGAVVAGHNIHFDLALIAREAARHGVSWTPPRILDAALLAAALLPGRVDHSIEALALSLGVEVSGRHTALGDAVITARLLAVMIEPLRAQGVRTLAEAEAFQARATAQIAEREAAGWITRSETEGLGTSAGVLPNLQRAIDSFLYRHRLADVMGSPPISVAPTATLIQTADVMRARGIGCVVVEPLTDGGGGFVSERDLLYAFAAHGVDARDMAVREVMSTPVVSMPEGNFLYRALGLMARRGLRYLVATGPDGEVTGVFTLRSLLQERALATLSLGDSIAAAETSADLARVQAELPGLAGALLADGLDARQVAAIISAEGQAMTARAGELAERIMETQGHGPAPAPFCLMVLGSGGRGESLLAPDQDNAVIVGDGYAGDLDAPDDWFTHWAEHLNRLLDEAGVPYCKGGVMAKSRAWRKTLAEWRAQVDAWVDRPTPENLLNVDIFFDFAPVLGRESLAARLRAHALGDAERARVLIRAMAEATGGRGTVLGLFGGFRKDERGRTDLKGGALLALVSGARVMALANGVEATATPDRLTQASRKAGAGAADVAALVEIHALVMRLILTQQIEDIAAGIKPTNDVDTTRLDRTQRKALKAALERLGLMDEMVRGVLG